MEDGDTDDDDDHVDDHESDESDGDDLDLVEERFLDPASPLGRAIEVIGRAQNLSSVAARWVDRMDRDLLARADTFAGTGPVISPFPFPVRRNNRLTSMFECPDLWFGQSTAGTAPGPSKPSTAPTTSSGRSRPRSLSP